MVGCLETLEIGGIVLLGSDDLLVKGGFKGICGNGGRVRLECGKEVRGHVGESAEG